MASVWIGLGISFVCVVIFIWLILWLSGTDAQDEEDARGVQDSRRS